MGIKVFFHATDEYMWDGDNVSGNPENACFCCWFVSILRFFYGFLLKICPFVIPLLFLNRVFSFVSALMV